MYKRFETLTAAVIVAVGIAWQPARADLCPADINDDGIVNVTDLLSLLGDWGSCPGCGGDINGDDVVNVTDLLILLGDWGPCERPSCAAGGRYWIWRVMSGGSTRGYFAIRSVSEKGWG